AVKRRLGRKRSNVQRTSEMRARLMQAAIDTLYRAGYSATTTIEVARRARVSRGAMLHHFPTRTHLLLATAHHIVESDRLFRREKFFPIRLSPGLERFYAASDVSWELHRRPSSIALLEIMMATRSDKALAKAFAPFQKMWEQARHAAAARMAADLGVEDLVAVTNLIRLHQACMRGLAIELMFTHHAQEVEAARQLQVGFDRAFAQNLVAEARKRGSRA
ncbi:MAG TPA: helix-turn-helix domain-containing protein, partial [Steroidobacteraceae bacterium]|nr:helix-turn-helix domain-containing protein [Steroidobacteraceae bacterium]